MLPTEKAAPLKIAIYNTNSIIAMRQMTEMGSQWSWVNQHLYICSDREIKEGDWIFNEEYYDEGLGGCMYQAKSEAEIYNYSLPSYGGKIWFKVEATTDKSLTSECIHLPCKEYPKGLFKSLPLIPEGFVRKYVEKQGIDEVMVDMSYLGANDGICGLVEDLCLCGGNGKDDCYAKVAIVVKVDKNNYISISKVKDSWTREEVEALLNSFGLDVLMAATDKQPLPYYKKWMEENL